jgi:hypothetical protein
MIKKYSIEITLNGMTSLLNYDLICLILILKEGRLKTEALLCFQNKC